MQRDVADRPTSFDCSTVSWIISSRKRLESAGGKRFPYRIPSIVLTLCLPKTEISVFQRPTLACQRRRSPSFSVQRLPTKDGDLRLSASNACLPKTEISVFVTECVFFTSTCYKLHMLTLHDVLYSLKLNRTLFRSQYKNVGYTLTENSN